MNPRFSRRRPLFAQAATLSTFGDSAKPLPSAWGSSRAESRRLAVSVFRSYGVAVRGSMSLSLADLDWLPAPDDALI